jgi:hypothetical protein
MARIPLDSWEEEFGSQVPAALFAKINGLKKYRPYPVTVSEKQNVLMDMGFVGDEDAMSAVHVTGLRETNPTHWDR